jgi:RNA polymerase sigma-70 factor (ECF subfamily)
MESSDVRLMLRFRDGDEEAFRQLFHKFSNRIVNYAFRFLGSRARAEEISQEVFLSVFKARKRYRPESEFSTWLFRITHNACLNEMRRNGYKAEVPMEDGRWVDPGVPGAESSFVGKEIRKRTWEVLQSLPENQRSAVILTRMEGLSYGEVAGVLECSLPAVKSLVFRATQALRDGLREFVS